MAAEETMPEEPEEETTPEESTGKGRLEKDVLGMTKRRDLSKLGKKTYFGLGKNMFLLVVANTLLVSCLLVINYLVLMPISNVSSVINMIGLFVLVFPVVMIKYMNYRRWKEVEDLFPVFLRDFVESIRGGMTVPTALRSVANNDYKSLTPYVKKMSAQLDWGIPVETVLLKFSGEVRSKLIARIISSVRESHRFGGNLADTLEALSNTAVEVDRLREERRLYLNSQMITGYIIFFVFLAVMIGLEKFLVPSLSEVSPMGLGGMPAVPRQENLAAEYKDVFRNLILIQGLFAGLAVGKMAEGAMAAGLKHSMFMMFAGALIFTLLA